MALGDLHCLQLLCSVLGFPRLNTVWYSLCELFSSYMSFGNPKSSRASQSPVATWCSSHRTVSLCRKPERQSRSFLWALKEVTWQFHKELLRKLPENPLYTNLVPLKVFHSEQLAKIFFLHPALLQPGGSTLHVSRPLVHHAWSPGFHSRSIVTGIHPRRV